MDTSTVYEGGVETNREHEETEALIPGDRRP